MTDAITLIKWYNDNKGRADEARAETGNALWTYLHTLAKNTPPEPEKQKKVYNLVVNAVDAFVCPNCAKKGGMWLEANPYDPENETIGHYLCRFHNRVSEHINQDEGGHKPIYNCEVDVPKIKIKTLEPCVQKEVISQFLEGITDQEIRQKLLSVRICE